MSKKINSPPQAYLLTFTTYGTWLHGNQKKSIDRNHNVYNTPRIRPERNFEKNMQSQLKTKPFKLNPAYRTAVLNSIKQTCNFFGWSLYAVHVRSNHVHVIVKANLPAEIVLTKLKRYASAELNKIIHPEKHQRYWTRHGSTRYIWGDQLVYPAMRYVIDDQGKRMACYFPDWYEKKDEELF